METTGAERAGRTDGTERKVDGRVARQAPAKQRIRILGVPVDAVTMREAVERILAWCEAPGERMRVVLTPNPEIIMATQGDAHLRAWLEQADLLTPDGVGIVWAAARLGHPLPERVTGIDLLERLLAEGAPRGLRVFLLGGAPQVAELAERAIERDHPGLRVVGTYHGYFGPDEESYVLDHIRALEPQLLVTGMGMGRDQRWLVAHREVTGAAVGLGVGGALDVLAGLKPRAPRWMIRAHLEWLYRLVREPSRWRRQLALPRFVLAVERQRRSLRRAQRARGAPR
ncbi:MAG: WecB/TagA/CpsF family glycosyltransferase [Bacillota bacterium]|nr:WecB/TagA/CpsF family glycosyltransferase [Bacillota bacterium]